MNVFGDLQREIVDRPGSAARGMTYADAMELRDRARNGQPVDKGELAKANEIVVATRCRMSMPTEETKVEQAEGVCVVEIPPGSFMADVLLQKAEPEPVPLTELEQEIMEATAAPEAVVVVAPMSEDDFFDTCWEAVWGAIPTLEAGEPPASGAEIWERAGLPAFKTAAELTDFMSDFGSWDLINETTVRADGTCAYRMCDGDEDVRTAAPKTATIRYLQPLCAPSPHDPTHEGTFALRAVTVDVVDFYHGNP